MKKIIYFTLLSLFSITIWAGCSKEDIEIYSGEDAIYFAQQWGTAHFVNDISTTSSNMKNAHRGWSKIGFGELIVNDSTLNLHILTSGTVKDYDRPFKIEVVADSTTAIEGPEYEILDTDLFIPAGEVGTIVRILFHETPRMNDENLKLQVHLIPNEHFSTPFDKDGFGRMPIIHSGAPTDHEYDDWNNDPSRHNIYINNFLVKPAQWNDYNMGVWSEKKYRLLLDYTGEMLGWNVETWNNNDKMWSGNGYQVGVNFLGKYLKEQYDKGREYWVLDPDGTMMWCRHAALNGLWSDDTRPEQMADK